ncbi:MAG: amine oxidase, partial [Thiohalocapsa sp.]
LRARAFIVATDGPEAARLLGDKPRPSRGTTCFYFAAPKAPFDGPYLVLNGDGCGLINSLLCPSNLSSAYAPPGRALINVNVFDAGENPDVLETNLRKQLATWYGDLVEEWHRLAVYRLPAAMPRGAPAKPLRIQDWLWVCGEYAAPPSIHWALASGNSVADAVAGSLRSGGSSIPAHSTAG